MEWMLGTTILLTPEFTVSGLNAHAATLSHREHEHLLAKVNKLYSMNRVDTEDG